jgi:hypothetical protein
VPAIVTGNERRHEKRSGGRGSFVGDASSTPAPETADATVPLSATNGTID